MRLVDRAYVWLSRPLGCFERGWGDARLLERPLEPREAWTDAAPTAPRWTRMRVHGALQIRDGVIESPETALPLEGRLARVRLLAPREGAPRGLVVALAAWNDEAFAARQRWLAPVAAQGIACLLLENPFYGSRRRVGQDGSRIGTVSDFVLMGRAVVRESHGLMAWARQEHDRVGVVGYSMGGQMAAMSAALAPWPVHVVAMAPAATPASVFLDGPLRRDVRFDALGEGGAARLQAILSDLSLLGLPPVAAPHLATLVGTRRDAIVPPADMLRIAKHWGIAPRWLDDGHVTALALRAPALAQAVIDTLARRP